MNSLRQYITEKLHLNKGINSGGEIQDFSRKVFALLNDCGFEDYINENSEFSEVIDTCLYKIYKKYHDKKLILSITKDDFNKITDDVHRMFEKYLFEINVNRKNIINAFTEEPESSDVYKDKDVSVRYREDDDGWYGIMITSNIANPIIFYNSIL